MQKNNAKEWHEGYKNGFAWYEGFKRKRGFWDNRGEAKYLARRLRRNKGKQVVRKELREFYAEL